MANTTLQAEHIVLDSLDAIEQKKKMLKGKVNESEERISGIWNKMYQKKEEGSKIADLSPTQRVMSIVSNSAGFIDAAILGWKLYSKFKGTKQKKQKKSIFFWRK